MRAEFSDKALVKRYLPTLSQDANKYLAGSVLCFAGGFGMAGAAVMCAHAAYRSGSGMVRLVVPESIYPICAASLQEAVFTIDKSSEDGFLGIQAYEAAKPFLDKASAVAFGCGCGTGEGVKATLEALLKECTVPLLIDADGINVLSRHIDMLKHRSCPVVLTPHEGEMARLTGLSSDYIRRNREAVAKEFAQKYDVTLLLKGRHTVIASKDRVLINPTGNAGLAAAGSGDVLSGVISALLSQGISPFYAAAVGAYVHGLGGDIAAKTLGERSLMARDIIKNLPKAFVALQA